jgi:hypothetical protein
MDYKHIPNEDVINRTVQALKANGINAMVVENGQEAKMKVLEMIPEKSEIMTMTSVTLDTIGLTDVLNDSGKYDSVRNKLNTMDKSSQASIMQKLGAAPDNVIGSVHAVTEDGKVFIASNTGSQLPAYVYGSQKVFWVVGAQKIVQNYEAALKRIYDYVLPLESERARKAYGVEGSNVSKLLMIEKEVNPERITMFFVKETLGY